MNSDQFVSWLKGYLHDKKALTQKQLGDVLLTLENTHTGIVYPTPYIRYPWTNASGTITTSNSNTAYTAAET